MTKKSPTKNTATELHIIIQKMIDENSDVEIAINGCALIEELLDDLLKDILVDSDLQPVKSLFTASQPLSSFDSMLSMAYAFAVISNSDFSKIKVIKKLSEYASHSLASTDADSFSFSKDPARNLLFDIYPKSTDTLSTPQSPKAEELAKEHFDKMMDFDPKLSYRLTFCVVSRSLIERRNFSGRLCAPSNN